jgi:hypothetical protein
VKENKEYIRIFHDIQFFNMEWIFKFN